MNPPKVCLTYLSRESSSTVSAPTTVGVDDDFTTSDTCVALRSTDDESPGGLDMVDGALVKETLGDDCFDDLFHDLFTEVFSGDFLGVLG